MGSLESKAPLHSQRSSSVRSSSVSSSSSNAHGNWRQRYRSRFARSVLFKRIDYMQLICAVGVFFFFIFLFQLFFLPGTVTDEERKSDRIRDFFRRYGDWGTRDTAFLNELDFGEDVKFEPSKILDKIREDGEDMNGSVSSRKGIRFGYKKPKLALVFADLWVDPHQILMVTVASALREIGYEIEVFSLEDGPVHRVWTQLGLPLSVITADENMKFSIDWLNYHGILVNSLKAVDFLSSLMQEPFRSVPLIWTIHEQTLAVRLRQYVSSGQTELVENWRKLFHRATVIVFPNYILAVAYSACDPGNYLVIPGSPAEAWKAYNLMDPFKNTMLPNINYVPDVIKVAVVGSQLLYKGLWLDHALVLKGLYPVLESFGLSSSRFKIFILAGESTSNYSRAVEAIARNLKYPNGTVNHVAVDEEDALLSTADVVIYGSFNDEHSFPDILLKAMFLGKPVVGPDIPMIAKYVRDNVNGFLFPKEDIAALTEIMVQLLYDAKLSPIGRNAASTAKRTARNLMVSESVEGYASLLENILMPPSEVAVSHSAKEIPTELKSEWKWRHFRAITDARSPNESGRIHESLDKVEKQFTRSHKDNSLDLITMNDPFSYEIWEGQKCEDIATMSKRREDEELKDRTIQHRGTWDDVYRNARRVDRTLHERDEGELLRTGQPLTIYEPYFGEGTWPFLHSTSLYRGIGLSTKGRRPEADDIDGPARLPLLNDAYYRDVLEEYGAFFAIANRIDRIHKNAWIGFQSWRATARMKSLSQISERSVLDAIEARKHGDALYFWARLDKDSRYLPGQDFWSFCDSINAGNCHLAFSEALEKMYGVKHNATSLPHMPSDEGTWSIMHCWVLPTRSFLEFVMFSRMFVDALDAQFYDSHYGTGHCYLSLSKDKHCYSRLLELLVNVWAYNSARRMVYVDPYTGLMQEQHKLNSRRGKMWVKWFQFATLKSMDEDLAEEFDSEHPSRRWLWPSTGEIFWQGTYVKEKNTRNKEKERKKQKSRDKIQRMRRRSRQKPLGVYVKPREEEESNTTDLLQARDL
ncbi:hypothetical protein ACS0TY_019722 [Phlomoides rotata]